MKRLLVFGDRNWDNYAAVKDEVKRRMPDVVISGCARGADTCGEQAASALGIEVVRFPAEWDKYGRAAGPIRNQQMLDEGKPTEAVGFHNDLANSKGTADMHRRLKKAGVPVTIKKEASSRQTIRR